MADNVETRNPFITVKFDAPSERSHEIVFTDFRNLAVEMDRAGLKAGRCVVVTDEHVAPLYGEPVADVLSSRGWAPALVTMPAGEETKSLEHLSSVISSGLDSGIDRSSPVVAVGGGVIGDLAGFAAAVMLRGVPLVQVPTSLIAQVDSSIGGKTGINHDVGKNLVGAFYQPALVLTDTSTLQTLPVNDWQSALSEVVKYALIRDPSLLTTLSDRWPDTLGREPGLVDDIVRRCSEIKVDIVVQDERESGVRAILNFGHTFGHALENVLGYRGITHGLAVAVGMRAALWLSQQRYPLIDFSPALDLVDQLPKPRIEPAVGPADLIDAMQMDKKRVGTVLRFVLLERPGSAVVVDDVSHSELTAAWEFALDLSKRG
jgi:3-dehydroquinate synthase